MDDAGDAVVTVERGRLQSRLGWLSAVAGLGVALWSAAIASTAAPLLLLVAWLALSAAVLGARLLGASAIARARPADSAGVARLNELGSALSGLAAGAAGTLFLPLLDTPARIALTVAACAGLAAALVEIGLQGRPFRLQAACCVGQFALAWWQVDAPGSSLIAGSLAGFGLLAALSSTVVERLDRQVLATSIDNQRLAESLAAEHQRALAAVRAKTHFIAAASHDLRQPAAALSLIVNLLRQRITDPSLSPMVRGLERSVHAMNDLLGQLLDLSRLDTGRIVVEPQSVDVDALLDDLLREAGPQAVERGLWLRSARCAISLDCDPILVGRMLRNLIDNALRHTSEGGITLSVQTGATFRLTVADTGPGIAAEHQDRIFDEHFQVGNESRQRANGLGLGLAIVRRIAALHDVGISLDSRPGRGSRFTLDFRGAEYRHSPGGARGAEKPAADRGEKPDGCRFAGRRLLLIEDDDTLAGAFLAWFRAAGFLAVRAASGAEALRVLDSGGALDVVVSDFRLPGDFDGLVLLELAGERYPAAFRLLVSGDIAPSLAARAADNGVPLLRKPVDPEMLHRMLIAGVG